MGVDNLTFEKQPAMSPEYEKLLFRKRVFQFAAQQNYPHISVFLGEL